MKKGISRKRLFGVLLTLTVIIMACVFVALRRVGAVIAIIRPAVIFTVSPGQTARLNVVGPTEGTWTSGKSRRMLLGFDVYLTNEQLPRSPGDTSCAKYHMVQRQACEVMLGPGEAASFDFSVPADGTPTQISPVFSLEEADSVGAVRSGDLVPTIEMREGGRTTGLLLVPAVQQVREATERR